MVSNPSSKGDMSCNAMESDPPTPSPGANDSPGG